MSTLPSLPTTMLGLQGIFNAAVGTYFLLRPAAFAAQMEVLFGGSVPLPMAYLSGLQLLNMGILTLFAASRPSLHKRTLGVRVGLHVLSAWLLSGGDGRAGAIVVTEVVFAVGNAVALPFVGSGVGA